MTTGSNKTANFTVGVLLFNLVVILGGALVRATKSGAGCGAHWPLCDGQVVPGLQSYHQIVEFSHRIFVGVGMFLVLWLFIAVRRNFRVGSQARIAATATVIFTLSEALIGAALVLFKWVGADQSLQRVFAVSAHLINTFLLVASLALTYWFTSRKQPVVMEGRSSILRFSLGNLILSMVVGVSGAVTALGDTLFPAKSASEIGHLVVAEANFLQKLRVVHPLIAIGCFALIMISIYAISKQRPTDSVKNYAFLSGILGTMQIGLGFLNLYTLAPLTLQLAHLLVADAFWISLVFLAAASLTPGAEQYGTEEVNLIGPSSPGSVAVTGTVN